MATRKQIAANRRNALSSTGPKTKSGKAVARLNAVKHGLTASLPVIPGEDVNECESFMSERIAAVAPVGPIEFDCALRLASYAWRLRRIALFESRLLGLHWSNSEDQMREFHFSIAGTLGPAPAPKPYMSKEVFANWRRRMAEGKLRAAKLYPEQDKLHPEVYSLSPEEQALLAEPPSAEVRLDAVGSEELLKLARYEAALTNLYERTLKQLQVVQLMRFEREAVETEAKPPGSAIRRGNSGS